MKSKILITGVAGFIGSNLADRLINDDKYEVIGIDNLAYGREEQIPDGVRFHKIDIRDKEIYSLFKDVDFVYHLAAKNSIIDCQNNPLETSDINVTGTVNVFEACKLNNVKKVIYAESSAMYEGSDVLPTPETEVNPQSFYSVSKFATMYFAEAYSRFYNLKSTALRYFCVYGPRQDYRRTIPPVFSSFIIKLLKGEQPYIFGTGEKRRDFVYVDDINDFHIQCMNDDRTTGKVFNLGSGKNYSINEIYNIISGLLKTEVKPLYKIDQPGEAFANLADITEAKKLDWQPKTDLTTGLLRSIEFIKRELEKGRI
jgi:UDP-glucose 4-epimerase